VWSEIETLYRGNFRRFERVAPAITTDGGTALDAVQVLERLASEGSAPTKPARA
jgi:hypothetical protein